MRSCIDSLSKLLFQEAEPVSAKRIFTRPPHITWDNYFSGEEVFHYAGERGFGLKMTVRRDCLPREIKAEFLHKKKTDTKPYSTRYRPIGTELIEQWSFEVGVRKDSFFSVSGVQTYLTFTCLFEGVHKKVILFT